MVWIRYRMRTSIFSPFFFQAPLSVPSQPGTPGQVSSPAPPQAMHQPPTTATEATVGGPLDGEGLPPSLEPGLKELSITETPQLPAPNIPETLTPAPVTVVRSTPAQAPPPSFPLNATPPTSLPGAVGGGGVLDHQFTAGITQTQVPPFTSIPVTTGAYSQSVGTFPSAPPTISLPSVAPTITLGPTPKLISS